VEEPTRQLAAIMFADMVGYTALMQEDEEGANEQRMRQREVLAEVVPRHNGKILQHYGDGSLSVFGSAVEAVECAVAIQAELRKGPGVPLRIGVHTGDIVYDDGGIYGDGVNVASRIEGLSAPGGILITGKVLDDIKNHPSLSTSPMGEVMLKNVKQPQRVFAITNEGLTVPSKEEVEAKAEGCTVVVRPAAGMEVMEFAEDDPGAPLGVGEALLKRIKDRAMVPWGMIYLGVAWVLVEVVKFMAGLYGWDPMVQQSFALVAFSGFLISLVVAWYHGERGRQHLQRNEVVIYIALIMATGGALTVLPSSPTSDMPGLASIGSVEDERPSVAVLPFDNLSDDGENVYFASGLHDEVLTQLQRVAGLRVISRTSVMEYADVDDRPNARVIADNLGVSHLTEATIQRVGDQLRVNIQLIDARTDDHVWAQSYDRQVRDAFDVQSDIAITIAGALATSLTDAERGAITHPPTTDPEAYRLYLQGLDYMLHPGYRQEDFTSAEVLFRRAAALDPGFALVRAELSQVHGALYWENFDRSADRLEAQMAEATEALRRDPDLPQAHAALGWAHYVAGDYVRALGESELAHRGLPTDAHIIGRIGYTHRRLGDWPEVFAAYEDAIALSPRNATLAYDLGGHSFLANRMYEEAAAAYLRAEMLAPDLYDAAIHRGHTYVHWKGELDTLAAVVARLPQNLRLPEVDLIRVEFALWNRDADALLALVEVMPTETFETQLVYYPKSLYAGWAHDIRGDEAAADAAFEEARTMLERLIAEDPDDERLINSLGYAYAGLGRSQDAAESAVRAMRARQRAGLEISEAPGRILAQAGEFDLAIPWLEALLEAHSPLSAQTLRLDPLLDPIREHAGFQELLERFDTGGVGG
jgi:serine/threonine-protein kinase